MPASRSDAANVKPRSDAYVGLLAVSLIALSTATLFAFLNWDAIKEKPKAVQMAPAGGGGRMAAPAGVNPAMPPGGPGMPAGGQMPPGAQAPPPGAQAPPPGAQAPPQPKK
jgi:hypothetical protein